jgi:nitroreductase
MHQPAIHNEILLQQLRWRYATKKFDPARRISGADWATLEAALVLTPSSFGLQPWKFIVITDPATKESLVPVSWGQRQVADCSHYLVIAIPEPFGVEAIDAYVRRIAEVRAVSVESLASYRQMMTGTLVDGPDRRDADAWARRQAYIALGNFMTTAALLGVDTCPMEGFEPEKYDEILGLSKRGLSAVVACCTGFRAADDKYAALPKVRFKAEDLIERI